MGAAPEEHFDGGSKPGPRSDRRIWVIGVAFNLLVGIVNMILLEPTYISLEYLLKGEFDGKGSGLLIVVLFLVPGVIAGFGYWLVNRRLASQLRSKVALYWWVASLLFWWISMIWMFMRGWLSLFRPLIV